MNSDAMIWQQTKDCALLVGRVTKSWYWWYGDSWWMNIDPVWA